MLNSPSNTILNVPNVLTGVRFLLSIVVFVLIPLGQFIPATIVYHRRLDRLDRRLVGAEIQPGHQARPHFRSVRR